MKYIFIAPFIFYLNNICQKSLYTASTSLIVTASSSKRAKKKNRLHHAQRDCYVIKDDSSLKQFDTVAFVTEENNERSSRGEQRCSRCCATVKLKGLEKGSSVRNEDMEENLHFRGIFVFLIGTAAASAGK